MEITINNHTYRLGWSATWSIATITREDGWSCTCWDASKYNNMKWQDVIKTILKDRGEI